MFELVAAPVRYGFGDSAVHSKFCQVSGGWWGLSVGVDVAFIAEFVLQMWVTYSSYGDTRGANARTTGHCCRMVVAAMASVPTTFLTTWVVWRGDLEALVSTVQTEGPSFRASCLLFFPPVLTDNTHPHRRRFLSSCAACLKSSFRWAPQILLGTSRWPCYDHFASHWPLR